MKEKIIYYNSPDFENFEKDAKIKLDKAWEMHLKYLEELDKDEALPLFICFNDYYVFSTSMPLPMKIGEMNLNGIWVNAKTGEIKVVKNSKTKVRADFLKVYRKRIKKIEE